MKNRKQLPEFGVLTNIRVDTDALVNYCHQQNLFDSERYNDIKASANTPMRDLTVANHVHKNTFFKEEDAQSLEGEKYRQLYVTEIDPSKRRQRVDVTPSTMLSRLKRIDPASANYLPEADERNYGKRNDLAAGEVANVLDMFASRLARVRFAYLAPHFAIAPHVDYDPSYISRYHIPLITNDKCIVGAERNGVKKEVHFAADGRVYFLNTGLKHWVRNDSDQPRIHLIVDLHEQKEIEYLQPL